MTLVGRVLAMLFQFTPLREGRLAMDLGVPLLCIFQFTPLREGRRKGMGKKKSI